MPPTPTQPPRVAVLGGGITGLTAALELNEAEPFVDWKLFDAAPRLGGVLQTVDHDGYRVELSADNFLTRDPWATDLCRRVGLEDELLETDPARRRALVVCRGRVQRVPSGFVLMSPQKAWPILASPILSLRGKARLAAEPFVPARRDAADESLASFARRRLGTEVYQRLVQPLVAGIYTADPEKLSLRATLPQFLQQEAEHGSLTRAALKAKRTRERNESGARYSQFVAPRLGMQQLVDAIRDRLPQNRVETGVRVDNCEPTVGGRWRLLDDAGQSLGLFDGVVVTLPAKHAAQAVRAANEKLASELASIEYAGASVVCFGVKQEQITRPIDGFGFVVPAIERRRLIAASFASYKFPGRAPDGRVLVRVFVGGALQPELAELDDEQLAMLARQELADLVGLEGEPETTRVVRWPGAMPQYHVGHLDRVERIEALTQDHPGLELAGAAYRGVGIPQCVRSAQSAVERLLSKLR